MKTSVSVTLVVVVFAAGLGSPARLAAQARPTGGSPSGTTSPGRDDEARAAFGEGVDAYDRGDHEAALAAFRRSYAIRPVASVLYNIGVAERASGRPVAAVRTFERWLAEDHTAAPARVESVRAALAELSREVGRVGVHVDREGTPVIVDGARAGVSPLASPLVLAPGTHVIEVSRPGYEAQRRSVTVVAGETTRLVIAMRRFGRAEPERIAPVRRPAAARTRSRTPSCPGGGDCGRSGGVLASPVFWLIAGIVAGGAAATATALVITREEERPATVFVVRAGL